MDVREAPPTDLPATAPPAIDPRLEADLADLLRPERPRWVARLAALVAVPAALVLLAALLAITLLTPDLPVGAPSASPSDAAQAVTPQTAAPAPPAAPPPAPQPRPVPATAPRVDDGWHAAAEGLAAAFAVDYLSWPQTPDGLRDTLLQPYLADGVDPAAGWQTTGPLVAATPIVTGTRREGPDHATVTLIIRVTGEDASRWVHLAVPVGRDDNDRLAVTDLPRLVIPDPAGTPDPPDLTDDPDLRRAVEATLLAAADAHLQRLGDTTGFTATDVQVTAVHRVNPSTAIARLEVALTDTVTDAQVTQALVADLRRTDGTWTVEAIR